MGSAVLTHSRVHRHEKERTPMKIKTKIRGGRPNGCGTRPIYALE